MSSVFVTLGTDRYPFSRLLSLLAPLAVGHDVIVQHGTTPPSHRIQATWLQYVSYEDQVELLTQADSVICHGGVGTIMTALASGHRPLVVARRKQHGEHVDDHQLQIVREFAARNLVIECEYAEHLVDGVRSSTRMGTAWDRDRRLHDAVASAVSGG